MNIRHISLAEASGIIDHGADTIYIFEDRWKSRRELLEMRLAAHQGRFRSIFARKCEVFRPSPSEAREFLQKYHIYGDAKCKYRYGLRYQGETVAVSTFSNGRKMKRLVDGAECTLLSYQWVRAASLPDCRVCGGMGRLLKAFINDTGARDVMAYADLEWSEGGVYEKLGFSRVAVLPPVTFFVDPISFERFPLNKIGKERKSRGMTVPEGAPIIHNLGSVKYVLTLPCRPPQH